LRIARDRLTSLGVDEAEIDAADARVAQVVETAVQEARDAPSPDPAQALTDVWADGGAAWRS
jgi:TPP-dependent pyruvate/acetoin dehydrogenase alpha subunit